VCFLVAEADDGEREGGGEVQVGRHEGFWWGAEAGEEGAALVGEIAHVLAGEPEQVASVLGADQEEAEVHDGPDGVKLELELGDHAEVSAAASEGPEEVAVIGLGRVDDLPVGGDDLGTDEIVGRQAGQPREPAEAATERQAGDTGTADEAARDGETMRLGGGVELAPRRAASAGGTPGDGIDVHCLHGREIDHHPALGQGEPGVVVAPTANRDLQALAPGKRQRLGDVTAARAAGDDGRPPSDGGVPDVDGLVVPRLAGR
jgi:hypothetical protein